jgi:D-sedoheptulose 7-phosphate isomerase
MHHCEEMSRESGSPEEFSRKYAGYLASLMTSLDFRAIAGVIGVLEAARARGSRIFVCGNGGSAATASHFAEDLSLGPARKGNAPFRAVSLTNDTATITAVANDEGYEHVFVRQLERQFVEGDVVIGISASGNSPNVVKALEYANAHGGHSVGITGFDGGAMHRIARHRVHVATPPGEYEPVEDLHLGVCHLIASYFKYRPGAGPR